MNVLTSDSRQAWLSIVRRPGFVAAAVLSLAFGIAVNATLLSVVDAFLGRTLPVRAPEEMVEVYTSNSEEKNPFAPSSYLDYREYAARDDVFAGVTASMLVVSNLVEDGAGEVLLGELVTHNYFQVLGLEPVLGRAFAPEEDAVPLRDPVVVLGHGLFQRRFGGDPGVLGRTVQLGGRGYRVVGIAPAGLQGSVPGLRSDFWAPSMMLPQLRPEQPGDLENRRARGFFVKARLRSGVGVEQAQAVLDVVSQRLAAAHPETNAGFAAKVLASSEVRIHPRVDRVLVPASVLLMGVAGLVLLVACVNVAGLFVARGLSRRREVALRLALGAGRGHVVRQMLAESLILAFFGGAGGLGLAGVALRLLGRLGSASPIPLALDLALNGRVLAASAAVALAAGLAVGLLPALQSTRLDLVSALKVGGESTGRRGGRSRLRDAIVVVQVAASVLLLAGAGTFLRSLLAAQAVDPGFEPEKAAAVWLDVGAQGYSEGAGRAFYGDLLARVEALPGVERAALTDRLPLSMSAQSTRVRPASMSEPAAVDFARVSPGYFETLGIPLLVGRDFAAGDPPVVVVNETAARQFWPDRSPLGQELQRGGESWTVVGVARDARVRSLGEAARPFVYLPWERDYESSLSVVARSENATLLPALLRDSVAGLDGDLRLFSARTLEEHLAAALLPARAAAGFLAFFGACALSLACVGIYGVVAFFAGQRTREIAVRRALGATPGRILGLVVGRGLRLACAGAAVGLGGVLLTAPAWQGFLLTPGVDVLVLGIVIPALIAAAFVAAWIPARRATRGIALALRES